MNGLADQVDQITDQTDRKDSLTDQNTDLINHRDDHHSDQRANNGEMLTGESADGVASQDNSSDDDTDDLDLDEHVDHSDGKNNLILIRMLVFTSLIIYGLHLKLLIVSFLKFVRSILKFWYNTYMFFP